jgi:hypothetical protein
MNLDDLLARLATLSDADRDWLLAALSAAAREQLLQLTRGELGVQAQCATLLPPAATFEPDASTPEWVEPTPAALIAHLAVTPVSVLVEILGAEPIWITAALLRAADWPWRAQLLQRLPHVAVCLCPTLETSSSALTTPFARALLERIVAKAAQLPEPATNRFESLVQKLAARRRRASWQLYS